jgi:hypothetical protein
MTYAPIFAVLSASSAVTALIGSSPVRAYPFGEAPQDVAKPYVVVQSVGGSPENYLSETPDIDSYSVQVDVYGLTGASARAVSSAVIAAIEPVAYVTSWGPEGRDPDTRNYRKSFTTDWWVNR